jgi:hypothetical protein
VYFSHFLIYVKHVFVYKFEDLIINQLLENIILYFILQLHLAPSNKYPSSVLDPRVMTYAIESINMRTKSRALKVNMNKWSNGFSW